MSDLIIAFVAGVGASAWLCVLMVLVVLKNHRDRIGNLHYRIEVAEQDIMNIGCDVYGLKHGKCGYTPDHGASLRKAVNDYRQKQQETVQ